MTNTDTTQLPMLPKNERWRVVALDGLLASDLPSYHLVIERDERWLWFFSNWTAKENERIVRVDFGPKGNGWSNDWPSRLGRTEANWRNSQKGEAGGWELVTNFETPGEGYLLKSYAMCNDAVLETAFRMLANRANRAVKQSDRDKWVGIYPPKELS